MVLYGVTVQMNATEQYFPMILLIMLYKVVLTFESVDEILYCDHSNESYWAVLSRGAVHAWNPVVQPLHLNPFSSTWHGAICFLSYYKYILSIFWLSLGVRKG